MAFIRNVQTPSTSMFNNVPGSMAVQDVSGDLILGNSQFEHQRTLQAGDNQARLQQALIGADAAKYPAMLAQQRWQATFPWLQQEFGRLSAQGPGGAAGGGQGPDITAGPVWNDQQIQQQVNAQRAHNDQATASRVRASQGQLAGRGYGANSPLAMALQGQYQNQNLAANTAGAQQTRWNAAQGNAQQTLQSQQAREAQFATRQQEDLGRQKIQLDRQNALIAALAGLA